MTHRDKIRTWEKALTIWRMTRDATSRKEFRKARRQLNKVLRKLQKTL